MGTLAANREKAKTLTWLTIDKPNNPSVKHDRNFEALKDAAKIFANGYGLAFCQISRIGGIQGTYRATFAKADKGQALAPTYEASETLAGNGILRVYTLKLKQANEGKETGLDFKSLEASLDVKSLGTSLESGTNHESHTTK